MRASYYTEEPDPTWTSFADEPAMALLVERTGPALSTARETKLRSLTHSVENLTREARVLAEQLKEVQSRLGTARAELRVYEALPEPTFDEGAAAKDIEFIKRLPGVLGIRVTGGGRLVVHVRTGIDYEGWHYDFGDYEISLGRPEENNCLQIYCTRTGCFEYKEDTHRTRGCSDVYCRQCNGYYEYEPRTFYTSGIYWSSERSGERTGAGDFCFGARRGTIEGMLREGRYAEAVHIIIDCLNSVNDGDRYRLVESFIRRPLPGTELPPDAMPQPASDNEEPTEGPTSDEVQPEVRSLGRRVLDMMNW